MRPKYHILISIILSIIVYFVTKSFFGAILCLFAGIFIDTDHLLDYWLHRKKIIIDKRFFSEDYHIKFGRIFVLMHSYEIILALTILYNITRFTPIIGLTIGWLSHLLLDQLSNGVHPMTYFLSYRLLVDYSAHTLLIAPRWKKNQ